MYHFLPVLLSLAVGTCAFQPSPSFILSQLTRPNDGQISFKLTASYDQYEIGAVYAGQGRQCSSSWTSSTPPTTWQTCTENKNMKWRFSEGVADHLEVVTVYVPSESELHDARPLHRVEVNAGSFVLPEARNMSGEYDHVFGARSAAAMEILPIQLSKFNVTSGASNPMSSGQHWCSSGVKFYLTDPNGMAGSPAASIRCATYESSCSFWSVATIDPAVCGPDGAYRFEIEPLAGLADVNVTLRQKYSLVTDSAGSTPGFDLLVTYGKRIRGGVDLANAPDNFPVCPNRVPCGFESGNRTVELTVMDMVLL